MKAHVIDTNHRDRGTMPVTVEFQDGVPFSVYHDGRRFYATGKTGTNRATGLQVLEMATEKDERIWVSLDGKHVFED